MNAKEALDWGRQQLGNTLETAYLDASLLLGHILQANQVDLILNAHQLLSPQQCEDFQQLIERRRRGEPTPYLRGQQAFWSLTLQLNSGCLIPRPETELLVEKILAYYPAEDTIRLADLGTGSGAIALALASERPHWQVVATDISRAALQIAQVNAQQLGLDQVQFRSGDWCEALRDYPAFHFIVSNPPYLCEDDVRLSSSLRYEPRSALAAGKAGLDDLQHIISQAKDYLLPHGCLWLEQGYDQASQVAHTLAKYGYAETEQYQDLSGVIRVSRGKIRIDY